MTGTVTSLEEQIELAFERADELWFERRTASKARVLTQKNQDYEDRLRSRIHRVHELIDAMIIQLWEAIDLDGDLGDLERWIEDNPMRPGKKRHVWCNGVVHFITDKQERLKYGYQCDCE